MAIQIYILSKLIEGNNYPYELKRQLSEPIPFDKMAGLTESKLYYHFESLAKQGLIEVVETVKEENRPDKHVFSITSKGLDELPKKIYKLFENATIISEMIVGLANIKHVDRDKVVVILEKKLQKHRELWKNLSNIEIELEVSEAREKFVEFLAGYSSSKAEHTSYWLEELIKQIRRREI